MSLSRQHVPWEPAAPAGGLSREAVASTVGLMPSRLSAAADSALAREAVCPVRVGAVSYLNTKPLVWGLRDATADLDLVFDLPSRLADDLAAGRLDVALIPSIEYFRHPGYRIVSDACIGCRGPVLSVKLLSRTPMDRIGSLALDEGSRTSAVLAQILLWRRFGLQPRLELLPAGATAVSATTDAVLLIGDRAIHPPREGFAEVWDLGEQWYRFSGLPFVFAMWVARPDANVDGLGQILAASRDAGLAHLDCIAREEAAALRLTCSEVLAYLRDNLYFFLDSQQQLGLETFRRLAVELGMDCHAVEAS